MKILVVLYINIGSFGYCEQRCGFREIIVRLIVGKEGFFVFFGEEERDFEFLWVVGNRVLEMVVGQEEGREKGKVYGFGDFGCMIQDICISLLYYNFFRLILYFSVSLFRMWMRIYRCKLDVGIGVGGDVVVYIDEDVYSRGVSESIDIVVDRYQMQI